MASIKSLTEAQCGSEAPLVTLSNNFGQSNSFIQQHYLPGTSNTDLLAQEYLRNISADVPAPSTFDMFTILQQSSSKDNSKPVLNIKPQHNSALLRQWCAEYDRSSSVNGSENELVNSYMNSWTKVNVPLFHEVWNETAQSSTPTVLPVAGALQESNAQILASEFLEKFDFKSKQDSTDITDSSKMSGAPNADAWINEFLSESSSALPNEDYKELHDDAYEIFSRDEEEWQKAELSRFDDQYTFADSNGFLNESDLLEKAKEHLSQGNISDAVLCYEAALQKNSNDAETWCSLGLCHAENEKDHEAIAAFRRSMDLDPLNQRTLLAFAVSLANEGASTAAMRHLDQWLHLFSNDNNSTASNAFVDDNFVVSESWTRELEEKFQVVASQPNLSQERRAELYNALSIFYNVIKNFDKATESIRNAIKINPTDAVLWNRLGASLANNDQSPDAIGAYRKALELFPAYVRARYNLGVSCMNMNAFRDAIGHFLSALQLQKDRQNSTIWWKLRSCILRTSSANSLSDMSSWIGDALNAIETQDIDAMSKVYARTFNNVM